MAIHLSYSAKNVRGFTHRMRDANHKFTEVDTWFHTPSDSLKNSCMYAHVVSHTPVDKFEKQLYVYTRGFTHSCG